METKHELDFKKTKLTLASFARSVPELVILGIFKNYKFKGGLPTYIKSGLFFRKKKTSFERPYLLDETELDKKLNI